LNTETYINGYTPQIKILKRNKNEQQKEEKHIRRNIVIANKSLKEREEEYRKARSKIFGETN